jgi:hypothetical protein
MVICRLPVELAGVRRLSAGRGTKGESRRGVHLVVAAEVSLYALIARDQSASPGVPDVPGTLGAYRGVA